MARVEQLKAERAALESRRNDLAEKVDGAGRRRLKLLRESIAKEEKELASAEKRARALGDASATARECLGYMCEKYCPTALGNALEIGHVDDAGLPAVVRGLRAALAPPRDDDDADANPAGAS